MDKKWTELIQTEIDHQVDKYISVRDYRFYQIGKLKDIAERLELYQGKNCLECKHFKKDLEDVVAKLNERINGSGAKRREYEIKVEKMRKHLQEKHHVYPANYFAYLFAFRFMVGGLLLGIVGSFAVFNFFEWHLVVVCWGLGMISGYFYGSRKDNLVRQSGKLL